MTTSLNPKATGRRGSSLAGAAQAKPAPASTGVFAPPAETPVYAAPLWELFELPLLRDDDDPAAPWMAAFSDPWPGGVSLYRNAGAGSPVLSGRAPARAVMGRLVTALPPAGSGRRCWSAVEVKLSFGTLSSRTEEELFGGANLCAIESDNGAWEVVQFQNAELQPGGAWRLSGLLRGQAGSEQEALAGAGAGKRFVLMTAR